MATLETPENIRKLQKALYVRAKKEPKFRFYALYDKVCRLDILDHAYARCRENWGAPGPDGVTFAAIDASGAGAFVEKLAIELREKSYRPGPVRRVFIPKTGGGERPLGIPNIRDRVVQQAMVIVVEPIFEADFGDESFGFRPKRGAHDALDAVRSALDAGYVKVLDVDIAAYFDSIPHDRLMKAVAERIVDSAVLALIKSFLEAPVKDERDGGGPKRPTKGTPQGGVISPLLANVYLNVMDRNFRRQVDERRLDGRLIRYADDFVIMTPRDITDIRAWMDHVLARLGLTVNESKTRVLDARQEDFDFLGHRIRWRKGRMYLDIAPKSLAKIREQLRERTRETGLAIDELLMRLRLYITGARNFFFRVVVRRLRNLDFFTRGRVASWLKRRHALSHPPWSQLNGTALSRSIPRWDLPRGKAQRPCNAT